MHVRTQDEDFKMLLMMMMMMMLMMLLLRTSRETKVSVLCDRLGNPLGRVHAGRPTNLREDETRERKDDDERWGKVVGEELVVVNYRRGLGVRISVSLYHTSRTPTGKRPKARPVDLLV